MYEQVRKFREIKPIFTMDFWNDGEYAGAVLPAGGDISISMPTATWIHVHLSTILIPTSVKRRY